MYRQVQLNIQKHALIPPNARVLVAVSGGADSMCLLHILQALTKEFPLYLCVCHVHHNLRGNEAEQDARQVEHYCKAYGLDFKLVRVDVPSLVASSGMSVEQAARTLRYQALRSVAAEYDCGCIATAHNRNDQAETFLINMLRGAALDGLSGMLPKQGDIIRPLLNIDRADIEHYCQGQQLMFCQDSTNTDCAYLRNDIRHHLLPYLKRYNSNITATIARNMDNLAQDSLCLKELAEQAAADLLQYTARGIRIDIERLGLLHKALQVRVLKTAFAKLRGDLQSIGDANIKAVLNLMTAPNGKKAVLSGLQIVKSYGNLLLTTGESESAQAIEPVLITKPGRYVFGEYRFKINYPEDRKNDRYAISIPYSSDKPGSLVIRSRRSGDCFKLENGGRKTIKKLLIDEKIPVEKRVQIPLVIYENTPVWIVGLRKVALGYQMPGTKYITIELETN